MQRGEIWFAATPGGDRPVLVLTRDPVADRIGSVVVAAWRARSGFGSRTSTLDSPGRLLAAAVAALPVRRRDWGRAMIAELAEVHGPSARWRFALSCARATLWLPPAGGGLGLPGDVLPHVLRCFIGRGFIDGQR